MKGFTKNITIFISISTMCVALVNIAAASNTSTSSYTASGTTSIKMAKLFKQLMQNNPNVQITTELAKTPKRNTDVSVTYTITGTTTKSKMNKLIRLFKSSKQIEVIANINTKPLDTVKNTGKKSIYNGNYPSPFLVTKYYNGFGVTQYFQQNEKQIKLLPQIYPSPIILLAYK